MKKLIKVVILSLIVLINITFFSGCKKKETLLFLNWGEYINDDVVKAFEDKYNCRVVVDIAESNELFYAKLKSGTTKYDLCCPTDYMIERMYSQGLLSEIDFSKIENYKDTIFMDEVYSIEEEMNKSTKELVDNYNDGDINKYHVPYFWGTFGLMYNKNNPVFVDSDKNYAPDILERNDAWKVYFFDDSLSKGDSLPLDTRVGMYNVVRFSYAASMIYKASNPNVVLNNESKQSFRDILSKRQYTLWGGDTLKHSIVADNLDICFNYTGDCLDMAYVKISEGSSFKDLTFYTYTPSITIAHVDSLVVTKYSKNKDLAYKFIDFLLDPVNCWLNARNVGYCPPLQATYDMIVNMESPNKDIYPYAYFECNSEEVHWLTNWAKAISTTYPLDEQKKSKNKGIPLSYFDNDDLKALNNIINDIKISK